MKKWNASNCKKGQSYLIIVLSLYLPVHACPRKHDLILLKQLLGDV